MRLHQAYFEILPIFSQTVFKYFITEPDFKKQKNSTDLTVMTFFVCLLVRLLLCLLPYCLFVYLLLFLFLRLFICCFVCCFVSLSICFCFALSRFIQSNFFDDVQPDSISTRSFVSTTEARTQATKKLQKRFCRDSLGDGFLLG